MSEEVSGERFATLENEVKHITLDIADIKGTAQITSVAIQSIDKSIVLMTEHVKQNQQLGPRIELLEKKVSKVEIKMAVYAGAIAAIVFVITKIDKIIAVFS